MNPPPSVPAAGRAAPRRAPHCIALAALLVCGAACGKKGAPLPPLSTLPRAPEAVAAKLQGDQVQIRFRIPSVTQSNVRPANLERVDVYALTGPTVPRDRFLKHATVVASVPVRRAVPEDEAPPDAAAPGEEDAVEQGALAVVYETLTPEALQPIVLPDDERKKEEAERQKRSNTPVVAIRTPLTPPDIGAPIEQAPMRHYAAVGITRSGRKGLPSMIVSVSLAPPPPAPAAPPEATVREAGVDLTWPEPAGLRRPVQRATLAPRQPAGPPRPGPQAGSRRSGESRPLRGDIEDGEDGFEGEFGGDEFDSGGDEDAGFDDPNAAADGEPEDGEEGPDSSGEGLTPEAGTEDPAVTPEGAQGKAGESFLPARPLQPWPSVSSGYHLYAVPAVPAETRPSPYSAEALPEQLTTRPLTSPKFTDPKVKFGDERCYVLRVAEVTGTSVREGPPSVPTCVKVADVFPPAAPRSLAAVASEGAVSLIWEGNGEADLAGYLVLRSGDGQPTQQLTPEPLNETTFRDTKVRRGARYVYTVIAVDTAKPPNRSAPSNEAEVFAR